MIDYIKTAREYYDKGYFPFPTFPYKKAPLTKEREKKFGDAYIFDEVSKDARIGSNIGIGVGKGFGVVAIDIDTPDEYMGSEIENKILSILPSSPFLRVGRPGRKMYLFKYNGEDRKRVVKDWVEFLSNGSFIILPPSIHPDTKNQYVWIENNLLDYYPEDLPVIPCDIYQKLDAIELLVKSFQQKHLILPNADTGRNNALVKQVSAALFAGKDITSIAQEIYIYDRNYHNPSLFTDKKEACCVSEDAYTNATLFAANVARSVIKEKKVKICNPNDFKIQVCKEKEEESKDYKKTKLPKFTGMQQEIFNHIYENSYIKRTRFCVASTISIFSALAGNRFNCCGIHPNTYVMIASPSGSGKDYPLRFPYDLFSMNSETSCLKGCSPESDTAILMDLKHDYQTRLDIVDEAGKLFSSMNDKNNLYNSKMADVYASLYTSSGKHSFGKKLKTGEFGKCFSPNVSLLCAITISDFKNSFNSDLISKGLGARFLFFFDDEFKDISLVEEYKNISEDILKFCKDIRALKTRDKNTYISMPIDISVKKKFVDITNYYRKLGHENEDLSPIYNRCGENVMKLSIHKAIGDGHETLLLKDLDFAISFMESYSNSLKIAISLNINSSRQYSILKEIENFIRKKGVCTTRELLRSSISQRYCLQKRDLIIYLDTLIEKESISLNGKIYSALI